MASHCGIIRPADRLWRTPSVLQWMAISTWLSRRVMRSSFSDLIGRCLQLTWIFEARFRLTRGWWVEQRCMGEDAKPRCQVPLKFNRSPVEPRRSEGSHGHNILRHDFLDRRAKVNLQPLLTGHFESARIEPKLVQYGCMNIGYIVAILYGVET